MELIVMLAAIAAMVCLSAAYYQKSHVIEIAVRAVIGFFSLYVVVSGIFFLIDQFNMLAALATCLLIELAAAFLLWKRGLRWKALAVSCALRPYAFVLCVAVLAVLLSLVKYDFFGMEQDQGVYQTKAIEMIYNSTKNQLDFEEYKNLTDPADKLAYQRMLPRFTGFYTDPRFPTFTPEDKISDVSGYYHGIPTFAAMLALFGKCFGLANMSQFQTLFFVCSIFLLFWGCGNLRLRPITTSLLLLLYALCPYVIWVSKSALTEPFLCALLAWFFYLATSEKTQDRHLLFAPVLVFSFYHISCYTLIPMFVCIFAAKYVYTKNREYLLQGILSSGGFLAGYIASLVIAPPYSYGNSRPMAVGFINNGNLPFVVGGGVLLILVALTLLDRLQLASPLEKFFKGNLCHRIFSIAIVLALLYLLFYGYRIGWHATPRSVYRYYGHGIAAYAFLTITAIVLGLGGFLIPLVLILTYMNAKRAFQNERAVVAAIGFAYLCLFMACFLRKEIPHYYYYARYLAPFMAPILLYCGVIVDSLKVKHLATVGVLSTALLLPFDYVLATQKDDSRISWDILEDLKGIIGENDAIVRMQTSGIERTALLAVRAMTGADLYPMSFEISEPMIQILEGYDNVYYLSDGPEHFANSQLVYEKTYVASEDNLRNYNWLLPFPSAFTVQERTARLWKVDPSTFGALPYRINSDTNVGVKKDGAITSTGEQGHLLYGPYIELPPGRYSIKCEGELLQGSFNQESNLDLAYQRGQQVILRHDDLSQYLDGNAFAVNLSFEVSELIPDFEFRIFVNEGAILKITSSNIEKE